MLEGKQLLIFKEMLASQGYTDASIVDGIAQRFALVGHIPEEGVLGLRRFLPRYLLLR